MFVRQVVRRFSGAPVGLYRAGRPLLAIRPVVEPPTPPSEPEQPRPRRYGLLMLLAGACLATWMIRPTYKLPDAAFDPVKRRVCIVFVYGRPSPADQKVLEEHGFKLVHIDPQNAQAQLEPLVSSGHTWLAISGVPTESLREFERSVVQCDLALEFPDPKRSLEKSPEARAVLAERLTPVDKPVGEILDLKNM